MSAEGEHVERRLAGEIMMAEHIIITLDGSTGTGGGWKEYGPNRLSRPLGWVGGMTRFRRLSLGG